MNSREVGSDDCSFPTTFLLLSSSCNHRMRKTLPSCSSHATFLRLGTTLMGLINSNMKGVKNGKECYVLSLKNYIKRQQVNVRWLPQRNVDGIRP